MTRLKLLFRWALPSFIRFRFCEFCGSKIQPTDQLLGGGGQPCECPKCTAVYIHGPFSKHKGRMDYLGHAQLPIES